MTSSPGPTFSSIIATCSAEVPLLKPTQCSAPQNRAKSFSNCATSGPRQNEQLSSVRAIAASMSLRIAAHLGGQIEIRDRFHGFGLELHLVARIPKGPSGEQLGKCAPAN